MWKLVVVLALVKCAVGGVFDFMEFDDPFNTNNYFFNRPGVAIRQHHGRCLTNVGGNNQEGVCLTRPECTFSGGQPSGRQNCLLGTCCVYANGCNQVTSKRVSYFEGSTTNINNVCTYRVETENANICQMRLDFDSLNLPDPTRLTYLGVDANGNPITLPTGSYECRDAYFEVDSPNINKRIPTLCGPNSGQHIYVEVNATRGERELVIKVVNNFATTNNNNNGNGINWKIKVTQIECPGLGKHQKSLRVWEDSLLRAPDGCLQYWQAPTGTIRNLGYSPSTTTGAANTNHYTANLNYAICFRRTNDMCGIDYAFDQFQLSSTYDPNNPPANNDGCSIPIDGAAGTSSIRADTDFLYIINGVYTALVPPQGGGQAVATTMFRSRYCKSFPANTVIRSVTPGPFYIFFKTDDRVLAEDNQPIPDPNAAVIPPLAPDNENGWQITYRTLYGGSCGTNNF